jgi:SLT domain-containing protein
MNRIWQVRRETVTHPDGQRRWDRAYQLLLRWAADTATAQTFSSDQEEPDAHCSLCPRLNQSPTADPHD